MKYIYSIFFFLLAVGSVQADINPTAGLKEIPLSGLTTGDGHTFHFYSTSGKLNRGYSEVFIALTDPNYSFVENFTVSDFRPLMDMGMSKHSTPIGKVEKVAGKPLYKTWFSFLMYTGQMGGSWSLSFNYTIGSIAQKVGVARSVRSQAVADVPIQRDTITQIGWFKDRHCVGSVTLPLASSCGIGCGTGAGNMANCWNGGLGIFKYDATESGQITKEVARSEDHFLLFDAQSKELVRAFLLSLPSDASGKISVKVTGYKITNGISANSTESFIPELIPDSVDHYLNAFHVLSIEGVVIPNQAKSYAGFAQATYTHTPESLAPTNLHIVNYSDGATVKFTPPANAGKTKSNLTGYKVRIYNNAGELQQQYTTVSNDTSRVIDIPGYTADGNSTFTVSALYSASNVEVESEASAVQDSSLTDIVLPVENYPTGTKWLQSFAFQNSNYYLSIVHPDSLQVGSQTVKAYINKQVDILKPYQIVEGGFKIVPTPFMRSMGHGSSGNTNLLWNATIGVYEGTVNFSMEGDWRVNLKIYDAVADTLVAGSEIDANGDGSTHYWDVYLNEVINAIPGLNTNGFTIYPTITQRNITVVAPEKSNVKIRNSFGQIQATYDIIGTKSLALNGPSGVYIVTIEHAGQTSVYKVLLHNN